MVKRALIVSGGGSKGAYAVGAVDYMVSTLGLEFDVIGGTSTGALISPMVMTGDINVLVDVYSNVNTSDILTERTGLGNILKTSSLYRVEPLLKLLSKNIDQSKADTIINSQTKQMFLTTVSLQDGNTVYFYTGPDPKHTKDDCLVRITDRSMLIRSALASACIPVFMPPVEIPKNPDPYKQYLDGGVRDVAPLKMAVQQQIDEVYVVLLSPSERVSEKKRYKSVVNILLRTIDMLGREVLLNDLGYVDRFKEALNYVQLVKQATREKFNLSDDQVDKLFNPEDTVNPFKGHRPLTVHVIQPQTEEDIPLKTLEFKPQKMRKMIIKGRERAQQVLSQP